MSEWTINVETPDGTTRGCGEDPIELFGSSLEKNPDALGAVGGADTRRFTLSATFQVEAESADDAAFRGCLAYWRAIGDAGPEFSADSRVGGQPTDDESAAVTEFAARATVERRNAD